MIARSSWEGYRRKVNAKLTFIVILLEMVDLVLVLVVTVMSRAQLQSHPAKN